MIRLTAFVTCLVLGGACTAGAADPPRGLAGSWVGTYRLVGDARISLEIRGRQALVALDVGHAGVQRVAVTTDGIRVRFRLPGRPAPLVFDGRLTASGIVGTVRQSDARGTFRARRGRAPELVARGLYTAGGGVVVGVVDDPYGPARLVDLATGRVRALFPLGSRFLIGAGFATREPSSGAATFGAERARIEGMSLPRIALREIEVRFRSAGRNALGDAHAALRARPAPCRRLGLRFGPDRARLPSRPRGAARPPRCRRARLRQARCRPVLRRPIPASRRRRTRSTSSRAMRRPPSASWPPSRTSTGRGSGSPATARPGGSCRSRPRASRGRDS